MDLAEIREWLKGPHEYSHDGIAEAVDAVKYLVAEVERLQAEQQECGKCAYAQEVGRDGYLQGLERAAAIVEESHVQIHNDPARKNGYFEACRLIRAETSGDQSELATLRDLERSYSQQLGEMARLCDTVAPYVMNLQTIAVPPAVRAACDAIMEYVDAVRPPEGSDPEWVMHILGPDDVIDFPSQFAALRAANEANKAYAKFMADDPSPNNPYCVAVVKNRAVEEV